MLKQLKKLNVNLEKNWTFAHKVTFTLSVFIMYRVFIRSFDFESMQVFNLLFIMAGFLVYTIDKLLPSVICFFELFTNKEENLTKKIRIQTILTVLLIIASFCFIILFYITGDYPWASFCIFGWCMAVYSFDFFTDHKTQTVTNIVRIFIILVTILGVLSIVHCFYYNVLLNVYFFVYIIIFFTYDFIPLRWIKSVKNS